MTREDLEFAVATVFKYGSCDTVLAAELTAGGYIAPLGDGEYELTPKGDSLLFGDEVPCDQPTDAEIDAFFAAHEG